MKKIIVKIKKNVAKVMERLNVEEPLMYDPSIEPTLYYHTYWMGW